MSSKLFFIKNSKAKEFSPNYNTSYYSIFLFQGNGDFLVDFVKYSFSGNIVLFLSPHQNFQWLGCNDKDVNLLQFHGDFYCIEYHKKEVACNGLLFNNIYLLPHITISAEKYVELTKIINKLETENKFYDPYSDAILKSYLQLILALCSKEKNIQLNNNSQDETKILSRGIIRFQSLLDEHFLTERGASFYASELAMSSNAFSKKIKLQYKKTPTELIRERVILEAKKMLHLSSKSIKEIAFELNFDDEFYFSRYFKKGVGVSPLHYREKVGISIVVK